MEMGYYSPHLYVLQITHYALRTQVQFHHEPSYSKNGHCTLSIDEVDPSHRVSSRIESFPTQSLSAFLYPTTHTTTAEEAFSNEKRNKTTRSGIHVINLQENTVNRHRSKLIDNKTWSCEVDVKFISGFCISLDSSRYWSSGKWIQQHPYLTP